MQSASEWSVARKAKVRVINVSRIAMEKALGIQREVQLLSLTASVPRLFMIGDLRMALVNCGFRIVGYEFCLFFI